MELEEKDGGLGFSLMEVKSRSGNERKRDLHRFESELVIAADCRGSKRRI